MNFDKRSKCVAFPYHNQFVLCFIQALLKFQSTPSNSNFTDRTNLIVGFVQKKYKPFNNIQLFNKMALSLVNYKIYLSSGLLTFA